MDVTELELIERNRALLEQAQAMRKLAQDTITRSTEVLETMLRPGGLRDLQLRRARLRHNRPATS